MDLHLKSELSKPEGDVVTSSEALRVLLLYEESGFVNSIMELLRVAASKVSDDTSLFCAIWDFDFVAEPLLMKVAAREACAADMVILVLRAGASVPKSVNDWLHLWFWAHPLTFVRRVRLPSDRQYFDCVPAAIDSQVENMGKLGDMNILTVGGSQESALAAFKRVVADTLDPGIHRPVNVVARVGSCGQASLGNELCNSPRSW